MSDLINTYSVPDTRKDWLFMVEIEKPKYISVTLIPDKLSADHGSMRDYLRHKAGQSWQTPDDMILAMIEDINNALVPKWLEVIYENDGVTLKVEDRQPGMENLHLH